MDILETLRALDPRALAMFAAVALVGFGADRARVNRARRRVEDYLRAHRYTVKRIRRSRRPHLSVMGSRHTIHFELEVYDLEFDTRRRGWASASSSGASGRGPSSWSGCGRCWARSRCC